MKILSKTLKEIHAYLPILWFLICFKLRYEYGNFFEMIHGLVDLLYLLVFDWGVVLWYYVVKTYWLFSGNVDSL